MRTDVYADICMKMYAGMCLDVCRGMCTDVRADMCTDMCTDAGMYLADEPEVVKQRP